MCAQRSSGRISSFRWVVLFASFLGFVAFAFSFQLIPPLLSSLQSEFGVDDAEAGLLMSMVMVPGIVLAFPAGLAINRYGFRTLGFASIISVAVGNLVTAFANSFITALIGRFILGVGGAFIVVGTPVFVPQWFEHKDLGKAMGIYGTNMPVSIILAFPTAAALTQVFGWRFPFYAAALLSFTCALFFVATAREGPLKGDPKSVTSEEAKHAVKNIEVWKVSITWMLFNTTTIGFLTWAPRLFHEFKSLDTVYSSLLATVVMYSAVFFAPFFGWLSDKLDRRKPFILIGPLAMASALFLTAYATGLPLVFCVLSLGISAATVPPLVMAIIAQNLPPRLSSTGFGIITLCQNIGIALSGPIGGFLLQTTQSLPLTFGGIALFACASAVTALTVNTK